MLTTGRAKGSLSICDEYHPATRSTLCNRGQCGVPRVLEHARAPSRSHEPVKLLVSQLGMQREPACEMVIDRIDRAERLVRLEQVIEKYRAETQRPPAGDAVVAQRRSSSSSKRLHRGSNDRRPGVVPLTRMTSTGEARRLALESPTQVAVDFDRLRSACESCSTGAGVQVSREPGDSLRRRNVLRIRVALSRAGPRSRASY